MAASLVVRRARGRKTPAAVRAAARATTRVPFTTPQKYGQKVEPVLLDPTLTKTLKSVRYPVPHGKTIQGKERHALSQAAKNWKRVESERLKKALQTLTHGRDIFAYRHMRTNQVVYSLSRTLEERNVLSQLIYHGKKTVPASLRKDMWVPYFSVHFAASDAQRGLNAYQLLRQFSLKRQLSPPPEMITHTEETIARYKPRDPTELEEWEKTWKPRIGQFMQKKERARVLMDQKATSVADLAAVIRIINRTRASKAKAEAAKERWVEKKRQEKAALIVRREPDIEPYMISKLSIKARKRLGRARAREQLHKEEIAKKIALLEKEISSLEGVSVKIDQVPDMFGVKLREGQVRVLWRDIQNAQYAVKWPRNTLHDELDHMKEHYFTHLIKAEKPAMEESDAAFEEAEVAEPTESAAEANIGPAETTAKPFVEQPKKSKTVMDKLKFWKN